MAQVFLKLVDLQKQEMMLNAKLNMEKDVLHTTVCKTHFEFVTMKCLSSSAEFNSSSDKYNNRLKKGWVYSVYIITLFMHV